MCSLPTAISCTLIGQDVSNNPSISFTIDSEKRDQVYSWDAAGFRIILPDGPLPDELNGKVIKVRTNTKSSFRYPPNTRIVSAIYIIESDISVNVKLEIEHCYRGNIASLVFGHCSSHESSLEQEASLGQFVIARKVDYNYSFNSTHGVIETSHFSAWGAFWETTTTPLSNFLRLFSRPPFPEEVVVFPYYQEHKTHIKLNLVIVKRLPLHIKVCWSLADRSAASKATLS